MNNIFKSVLAGLAIGLGGTVFVMADNKFVGSFLFSFGLLSVLLREYKLFTGWVAWAEKEDCVTGAKMLLFNLIGAIIAGLMFGGWATPNDTMIATKLAQSPWQTFLKSVGCGICMYLAVSGWKRDKNVFAVIMGVTLFIIAGFEHCIADMFYFVAARTPFLKIIPFMIVAILGNTVGAQATRRLSCEEIS